MHHLYATKHPAIMNYPFNYLNKSDVFGFRTATMKKYRNLKRKLKKNENYD